MKKKLFTILSLALSLQLVVFSFGVSADDTSTTPESTETETDSQDGVTEETEDQTTDDSQDATEEDDEDSEGKPAKDRKANDNAKKGLENALEHVKGTPAEKVISDLLDLPDEDLQDEDVEAISEQLDDVLEQDLVEEDLTAVADAVYTRVKTNKKELKQQALLLKKVVDIYEKAGSVEQAVDAQKDVLTANVSDLQAYKRLGSLYKKLGEEQVRVYVEGEQLISEVAPIIEDGTTLVPLAAISVVLGANVEWNEEERSITLTRDDTVVKLTLGSKTAYINGEEVELRKAVKTLNGRTIVPVKFINEAFGSVVQWEPESKSVVINEPVEEGTEVDVEEEVLVEETGTNDATVDTTETETVDQTNQ
ncbi:MAG: copper amine oxidase N-terminal domain-containing protein [Bacilli bacterium]